MTWPSPPKLIRNSTPTILMRQKIRPSRSPTKMVGSAAGKQDLPEQLPRTQIEAAADVDQHAPRAAQPFDGLQDHRRQPGDESHHDDGRRRAAENDQEQRIHQHDRRRGHRRDPALGRARSRGTRCSSAPVGMPTTRHQQHRVEAFLAGGQQPPENILLGDEARKAGEHVRRQRHDVAVEHAGPQQHLHGHGERDKHREAETHRHPSPCVASRKPPCHAPSPRAWASASCMPRLASSRRSLQICAT